MAEWWESAPLATTAKAPAADDNQWWKAAPIAPAAPAAPAAPVGPYYDNGAPVLPEDTHPVYPPALPQEQPEQQGYISNTLEQLPAGVLHALGNLVASSVGRPLEVPGHPEYTDKSGLAAGVRAVGHEIAGAGEGVENPYAAQVGQDVAAGRYIDALKHAPAAVPGTLLGAAPDIAGFSNAGMAPYIAERTQALHDTIEANGGQDRGQALADAVISTLLGKFGFEKGAKILGEEGGRLAAAAKGGAVAAPVTGGISLGDYLTEHAGTPGGVNPKEAIDQAVTGAILGGAGGAAAGGALKTRPVEPERPVPPPPPEPLRLPPPPPTPVTLEGRAAPEPVQTALGDTVDVRAARRQRTEHQTEAERQAAFDNQQRAEAAAGAPPKAPVFEQREAEQARSADRRTEAQQRAAQGGIMADALLRAGALDKAPSPNPVRPEGPARAAEEPIARPEPPPAEPPAPESYTAQVRREGDGYTFDVVDADGNLVHKAKDTFRTSQGAKSEGDAMAADFGAGARTAEPKAPDEHLSAEPPKSFVEPERTESNAPAREEPATLDSLQRDIKERLKKVGISDAIAGRAVGQIVTTLGGRRAVGKGRYQAARKLIEVALRSPDTGPIDARTHTRTLNHEIVHALRDLGLFTDAEWRVLVRAAQANKTIWDGVERYRKRGMTGDALHEEAIADLHGAWVEGRVHAEGAAARLLQRIGDFFAQIKAAFNKGGYRTAEDIFRAIDRGEFGKRIEDRTHTIDVLPEAADVEVRPRKKTEALDDAETDVDEHGFYSPLLRAAKNLKQEKGTPEQMLAMLRKSAGVKAEEIEHSGLAGMLELHDTITKGQLVKYLTANRVKLKESVGTENPVKQRLADLHREIAAVQRAYDRVRNRAHSEGPNNEARAQDVADMRERYENLLEKRERLEDEFSYKQTEPNTFDSRYGEYTIPGGKNYRETLISTPELKGEFRGPHFNEKNLIVHLRTTDRNMRGNTSLIVEEIQSDPHQQGRREGYLPNDIRPSNLKAERKDGYWEVTTKQGEFVRNVRDFDTARTPTEAEAIAEAAAKADRIIDKLPNLPYKNNAWTDPALKRAITMAVTEGKDQLVIPSGEAHIDRYAEANDPHMEAGLARYYDEIVPKALEKIVKKLDPDATVSRERLEYKDGPNIGYPYDSTVLKLTDALKAKVKDEGQAMFDLEDTPDTETRLRSKAAAANARRTARKAAAEAEQKAPPKAAPRPNIGKTAEVPKERPASPAEEAFKKNEKNAYTRAAQRAIDTFNEKIGWRYGALGKMPEQQKYLVKRYLSLGKVDNAEQVGKELYRAISKADKEDSTAAYNYLTTRDADPKSIGDPAVRAAAVKTKEMFNKLGDQLVEAGLLSEESVASYKDMYLPRLYLKHLLGENNVLAMGNGKKTSDLGNLKERKDIPEDVRRVILGEIKDPAFLASFGVTRTMRDLAILDFIHDVSQNKKWVPHNATVEWKGRDVSPFWLRDEARSLRERARHYEDKAAADEARQMADEMETKANGAITEMGGNPGADYRQVPDSNRYGAMRGLWVRKEIYNDLVGSQQFVGSQAEGIEQILAPGGKLEQAGQWWKASHVPWNPPTQFRNFVTNMGLLNLIGGVPVHRIPRVMGQAVNSLIQKDKFYKIAQKYGLFKTTFSNQELGRISKEWIRLQKGEHSGLSHIKAMAASFANVAGDVYQLMEAVGKIAKLRDAMAREGKSEAQAMIEAHDTLFDYSLVPRNVLYLRNTLLGAPFITFTYKVLPKLMQAAIKYPNRYLPAVAIFGAMKALTMSNFNITEDDYNKIRKALPEWMNERGHMMLWPYKDESGKWQAIDLGYFMPWGMFADAAAEIKAGKYGAAASSVGMLSGPIPNVISALQTNKDPFTGKDIVNDADPREKKLGAMLNYIWNLAAPGFISEYGAVPKLAAAMQGKVNKYTGEPSLSPAQAALRFFGINVYPVDAEASRAQNLRALKFQLNDIKARMRSQLRDRNLTDADRENIKTVYMKLINKQVEMMHQYATDSELNSKLIGDDVFEPAVSPAKQAAADNVARQRVPFADLVKRVEQKESGGNEKAVSPKGAVGPMQTMPATLKDPGYGVTPAKNDTAAEHRRVGKDYLKAMIVEFNKDQKLALMAYNWGPKNVKDWMAAGEKPADVPTETANYVNDILQRKVF